MGEGRGVCFVWVCDIVYCVFSSLQSLHWDGTRVGCFTFVVFLLLKCACDHVCACTRVCGCGCMRVCMCICARVCVCVS